MINIGRYIQSRAALCEILSASPHLYNFRIYVTLYNQPPEFVVGENVHFTHAFSATNTYDFKPTSRMVYHTRCSLNICLEILCCVFWFFTWLVNILTFILNACLLFDTKIVTFYFCSSFFICKLLMYKLWDWTSIIHKLQMEKFLLYSTTCKGSIINFKNGSQSFVNKLYTILAASLLLRPYTHFPNLQSWKGSQHDNDEWADFSYGNISMINNVSIFQKDTAIFLLSCFYPI